MIFQITTLFVTDICFDYIAPNPTGDDLTSFFETVVLLSKGEIDSKKVRVEFSLENMDMSGFQKGATYPQIKEYVQEHSGLTSICETVQRPAGRYQCPVSNRQSANPKKRGGFLFFFFLPVLLFCYVCLDIFLCLLQAGIPRAAPFRIPCDILLGFSLTILLPIFALLQFRIPSLVTFGRRCVMRRARTRRAVFSCRSFVSPTMPIFYQAVI